MSGGQSRNLTHLLQLSSTPNPSLNLWVIGLLYLLKRTGIFFDSFARSPTELGFDTFLRKHSSSWTYNNVLVQNPMTLVCGQHVIVFLLIVSTRGKSAWIKLFSSDLISNDDFVYCTIKQIFHTNTLFYPVGDFIM